MFELQIALKYLIPRKKSLSTALISALSVLVISLVIWLVLVFLSVTNGIEKNWLHKLTSIHAPVRISPTDAYYSSYYYHIDSLSAASSYTFKTIGEKKQNPLSDPYSEEIDPEIPLYLAPPDRLANGDLRDPVKTAYHELNALKKEIKQISFQDYEISGALLRIIAQDGSSTLSQMTYLLSIAEQNPRLRSLIIQSNGLPIDFEEPPKHPPSYAHFVNGQLQLPRLEREIPILLPKSYLDGGVALGGRGTLSFSAHSAASSQEQRIWIRVAGFYDPGIVTASHKCILVPPEITRSITTMHQTFSPDGTPMNGIFVWINDLTHASDIAAMISKRFSDAGISSYWKVETYQDFEFSKDLMLQFQSDRTLLLLIASILLTVACSNIISLLVLLVNDKKKEIAILQAMGASFRSIAIIFSLCGMVTGVVSCLFGSLAAIFTLRHIDLLVSFLSHIQGHAAFNPAFFGQSLPNQLSGQALLFVLIATPLLSIAAGLVPAWKATRIRPSSALRVE